MIKYSIVEQLDRRRIDRKYDNVMLWLYRDGKLLRTFLLNSKGEFENPNDFYCWLEKFDRGEFNA